MCIRDRHRRPREQLVMVRFASLRPDSGMRTRMRSASGTCPVSRVLLLAPAFRRVGDSEWPCCVGRRNGGIFGRLGTQCMSREMCIRDRPCPPPVALRRRRLPLRRGRRAVTCSRAGHPAARRRPRLTTRIAGWGWPCALLCRAPHVEAEGYCVGMWSREVLRRGEGDGLVRRDVEQGGVESGCGQWLSLIHI